MNEARNIRRCLESISWCTEIIVIDSGSTDDTLSICKELGARVINRPWPGYVEQKRFGLLQSTGDWVLNLDADEEVSPELKDEILTQLAADDQTVNGFELSRVVFYLNRWWRKGGWYPEYRLRLCRRSKTTWGGADPHEKAIVDGNTKRLKGELWHYTYRTMTDHIQRLNQHSTSAARTMFNNKKRFSLISVFFNPIGRFFKFYIFKKGYLEGGPGLVVALFEAFYVLLKYLKLWELERHPPQD
jgi:glycosyltransferase involved in cell wall biosynthesis